MSNIGVSQARLPPRIICSYNAEIGQVSEPARPTPKRPFMDGHYNRIKFMIACQ